MKITTTALTLALSAGVASAQISQANGLAINATPEAANTNVDSFFHNVDFTNLVHNNVQGSSWNRVLEVDLGEGEYQITGLSWDLATTSQHGLNLEDVRIAILNASGDGVVLNPFASSDYVGFGEAGFDMHDLTADGMAFDAEGGSVFIEFYSLSNNFGGPEAWHAQGSQLTLEASAVPAPGALALTGLGGIAALRRRRR